MVDNVPPEGLKDIASLAEAPQPSRYELSFRGKWLLAAVAFSLLAWALIAMWGVQLASN